MSSIAVTRDLEDWLERVGLGRYAAVLARNDIDWDVLPELDDADLASLGLSLGHRRKLLKAIAAAGLGDRPRLTTGTSAAGIGSSRRRSGASQASS